MKKIVNRTLTVKQKKILDFITSFNKKHGYAPSLEEIASHSKLNAISTVHHHIKALKTKGYLKKEENQPRGVSPFEKTPETTEIPLLGFIAAGKPIEPIENPEPIKVPKAMVTKKGNYYALKVEGDSMVEDGIWNNDIVIVKQQQVADDRDIVVAITEDGATLKMFRKRNGSIYLEPRNKSYSLIYPKELEIRGKFVGLIRNTI
jgi:repressor LexA